MRPTMWAMGRRAVGAVLVVPALALLVWAYVVPAVGTVMTGLDENAGFVGGDDPSHGFGNYGAIVEAGLGGGLLNALRLAAVPLFLVVVVAPVLAVAAHAGGAVVRRLVRLALVLPLAAYAPAAVATAGRFSGTSGERALFWWSTVGLFTAVAVIGYLGALRASSVPGVLLVAGVGAAAAVAVTLQDFTYTFVGAPGPRGGQDVYPMQVIYRSAFVVARPGVAAAGSSILLLILMLLGLLVTVALVVGRARLSVSSGSASAFVPARLRTGGAVVAGVVGVAVLALTVVGLAPWFGGLFADRPPGTRVPPEVGVMTWAPALISAAVAIPVTALAAFGIGWLRPLGRHSEWLLLPFGLFLFVGAGPLSVSYFERARGAGRLDSFLALVPPTWVVVPALFVLTLLFRGQEARGGAVVAQGRLVRTARLLLPVLPMVGLAFLVTWVVRAQDLLWPLLVAQDPALRPGPVYTVDLAARAAYLDRSGGEVAVGLALPFAGFAVLVLVAAAAQLLYLDRVALRAGVATD